MNRHHTYGGRKSGPPAKTKGIFTGLVVAGMGAFIVSSVSEGTAVKITWSPPGTAERSEESSSFGTNEIDLWSLLSGEAPFKKLQEGTDTTLSARSLAPRVFYTVRATSIKADRAVLAIGSAGGKNSVVPSSPDPSSKRIQRPSASPAVEPSPRVSPTEPPDPAPSVTPSPTPSTSPSQETDLSGLLPAEGPDTKEATDAVEDATNLELLETIQQTMSGLVTTVQDKIAELIGRLQALVFGLDVDSKAEAAKVEAESQSAGPRGAANSVSAAAIYSVTTTALTASDEAGERQTALEGAVGDARVEAQERYEALGQTTAQKLDSGAQTVKAATASVENIQKTVDQTLASPPPVPGPGQVEQVEVISVVPLATTDANGVFIPVQAGHSYTFKISGTYKWAAAYLSPAGETLDADAVCAKPWKEAEFTAGSTFVHDPESYFITPKSSHYLDVLVGGSSATWMPIDPSPFDGACSSDHSYTYSYAGDGSVSQLNFKVFDDNHMDNLGVLAIQVSDKFEVQKVIGAAMGTGWAASGFTLFVLAQAAWWPVRRRWLDTGLGKE